MMVHKHNLPEIYSIDPALSHLISLSLILVNKAKDSKLAEANDVLVVVLVVGFN